MYFNKLDKIQYQGKTAVNITNAILLKYKTMNKSTLWQFHTVVEGQTPESIAYQYYGDAKDHWVILMVNNIVDPFYDWALSNQELVEYCKVKYGATKIDRVHHVINQSTGKQVDEVDMLQYVTRDGIVFKALPNNWSVVTNLEYENKVNDEKREVKILSPKYLQDFKNQFEDLMNREGLK